MCPENHVIALQEAYGRIKLCKTMVADHFIPAYLASLSSFIDSLECDQ